MSESSGQHGGFSTEAVLRGTPWLAGTGPDADVVVSSRVRLARNFAGLPFLTRATSPQRSAVVARVYQAMSADGVRGVFTAGHASAPPAEAHGGGGGQAAGVLWVDMQGASTLDRTLMVERHLISKEHAKGDEPRAAAISLPDESVSLMVNEEDHLRLQVLMSGLNLDVAFARVNEIDDHLEAGLGGGGGPGEGLEYAFSSRFGYLTACPTNVGTGIRVSVMLHLPALKLTGEMDKVRRAARDMSLAVRGYYGEGTEAAGEFYQLSNQTTLGKSEEAILAEFEGRIVPQIVAYERAARAMLAEKRRRLLEDRVYRALGTLRHARLLTPEEAIALLSDVRLGVLAGVIRDVKEQTVNQLLLLTQPAHLQRALGQEMDQGQRREARADLVRERLAGKELRG